ncbi:hypothetical protein [Actinoplanes couchii]|uniref:Ricin B lectin domain-containing protein n=1 Tax=Actinoplanes couchii TaxID=403638 RepID=A0ABQ3XE64_9ACTN|nr:hypothetical protein [Actinoplanes couchii]MDR6317308.1 hypothetical protein [Actinoplanes couchii]GID56802.1 hypothetical protein Aco03nite_052060 [Actinoplanes couchii]
MSDDRIQQGLDSYADHLQRTAAPALSAEIRRRGDRRRRNRATGAAFAAVLIAAAGLGAVLSRGSSSPEPILPAESVSPSAPAGPTAMPSWTGGVTSNVDQIRQIGVDLDKGVLIDVADAGTGLGLAVGPGDVVDFTGSAGAATAEMSLIPAPVKAANRVIIVPVARLGWCVTDTGGVPLSLQPCREGAATQTWRVAAHGDSGAFNLIGPSGEIRGDETGMVATGGFTGLQTKPF